MTEVDTNWEQNTLVFVKEMLRVIANNGDPVASLSQILESVCALSDASGAVVLIFEDPRLLISEKIDEAQLPDDVYLAEWVRVLNSGLNINPQIPEQLILPSTDVICARVDAQDVAIGVCALFYDVPIVADDNLNMALSAFLDAVTTIVSQIRMKARHEKLGRNQSEFMRIVSHDLRSPLTSMKGFASMLESGMVGDFNEQQAPFVDKILAGINQMTLQIDNFQDAGRYDPETGFYEMERSPCDLFDMVSRIVSNYLLPAEKQELHVTTNLAEDVPVIAADVNMLERAIINLVDNAIKYSPNGGQIEVGVQVRDDAVVVFVKDNGLGISQENQKMLFERHVRIARKEHKRVKGSGLGLFIVRSVAQRHGGDAWVESEEGKGSTFFISIPLNEENSIIRD